MCKFMQICVNLCKFMQRGAITLKVGIGSSEVNVFEDAESQFLVSRRIDPADGSQSVLGQFNDFTRQHFASEVRSYRQECARFRRNGPAVDRSNDLIRFGCNYKTS